MNKDRESLTTTTVVVAIAIGVAIAVGILTPVVMFWGAPIATWTLSFVAKGFVIFAAWLGVSASIVWLIFVIGHNDGGRYGRRYDREDRRPYAPPIGLLVFCLLFASLATFLWGAARVTLYEDDVAVTPEAMAQYEQRAPFVQAKTLLNRNRGGVQVGGGDANPTFLGGGQWSVLLDGGGSGLKASGVVVWDGEGEGTENFSRCQFDGATSALNGSLWNSLVRELRFFIGVGPYDINRNDAYGFCDEDDKAVLVVPVTRYIGFAPTKRVFAGVAVVRSSDNIEFIKNVEPGTLPGPVYPESLVMEVEGANAARDGSMGDVVFVRSNYLTVDGEDGSPNSRNSGQFMLTGEDGNLYAVSPMNRAKGSGREIVAVAVTPVSYAKAGEVNLMVIHELPAPRQANAEVASLVRSEFSSLNWFAGLEVMEVTPIGPDQWVGFIGRDVSPEHQFTVTADRTICVTEVATGRSLGCSGGPTGAAPESNDGSPSLPAGNTPDGLAELSAEELISLRDAVNRELDQRVLGSGATPPPDGV